MANSGREPREQTQAKRSGGMGGLYDYFVPVGEPIHTLLEQRSQRIERRTRPAGCSWADTGLQQPQANADIQPQRGWYPWELFVGHHDGIFPDRSNQVGWIDQEKSRRGARQTAPMDTIRAGAECPHLPGVAEDLYRPNYIRPVESFVRFAGSVARVKCEWVSRLERSNCRDRPSPQNVLLEPAPVIPHRNLP